ncbi:MAG: hypothetical protein WC755_06665 [Candidatus Woesearchaeota archaeon]|jgi:hypothetical protein
MKKNILSILVLLVIAMFVSSVVAFASTAEQASETQKGNTVAEPKLGQKQQRETVRETENAAIKMAKEARQKSESINSLNVRYSHLDCKAELVKAQSLALGSVVETSPSADKITSDLAELKRLADAGDKEGYNTYLKTVNANFVEFHKGLNEGKKAYVQEAVEGFKEVRSGNKTLPEYVKERKQVRETAKTAWKENIDEYTTCIKESRRKVVETREGSVSNTIKRWNEDVVAQKGKGLDTTEQEKVIADAEDLDTELTEAIATEDDAGFKEKMNEINDMQLKIHARYHIAKVETYLAKAEPFATTPELQAQVAEIKALLESAKVTAEPGKRYAEGEFDATWNNIKTANQKLNDLVKQIKAQAKTTSTTN